jgi:glycosyltransferase involved in cell wall biosynthesis
MTMTSANRNPRIFIVVPAYNEARMIGSVAARLLRICPNVVVVDDGSRDDTAGQLAGTSAYWLRHPINRGQGAALQTGIEFALRKGAEIVVTFDADGQHDENDIERMVAPIARGECDVTLGSRFLGAAQNMPLSRKIVLKLGILFTRVVSRIQVSDTHNGLRAFSRSAALGLRIRLDRMGHASEILDQIQEHRWRFQEVPVTIHYSAYSLARGQSSWNALTIGFQVLFRKLSK